MTDRVVKTTLIIDESGAVKAVHAVGDESGKTTPKLEHLDKGVKQLGHSFGGLKTMIGAGLGALGVGGVAYGLKDIVSGLGETTAEVEKFHAISGIGAQKSLDLTAALKARGIGPEAGANAFKFLAKNIQTAERQQHSFGVSQIASAESGKAVTSLLGVQALAFKELGINVKDFSKLGEEQKLDLVTKKFEGMAAGAQKTRLAVQLFGRGGTALLPVLDKGALGLGHFTDLARKYFPTLKEGSAGLEEWKLKQDEFDLASEGLEFTLGMKLIPVLSDVASELSKTVLEIEKGHGTWGTLERDGEAVVKVGKEVIGFFEHSTVAAEGLHVALGLVGTAWGVEKAAGFVKAVKGLTVLKGINKLLGVGGLATTAEEAGDGAAAGMAAMLPELAALTLAVAGVYEAAKHAEEIREFFGIGKTQDYYHGHKINSTQAREVVARPYITHPALLRQTLEDERHHHETVQAPELQALKVDLHLDSVKVAEQMVRNGTAIRRLSEGTAHQTSKMAARK